MDSENCEGLRNLGCGLDEMGEVDEKIYCACVAQSLGTAKGRHPKKDKTPSNIETFN